MAPLRISCASCASAFEFLGMPLHQWSGSALVESRRQRFFRENGNTMAKELMRQVRNRNVTLPR
jgi:hypothetical protein